MPAHHEGIESKQKLHVALPEDIRDWLHLEAAKRQVSLAEATREQLRLARKYQQAIREAESAPARFVRDLRRDGR